MRLSFSLPMLVILILFFSTVFLHGCILDDMVPSVTLVRPSGGECWRGDTVEKICWDAYDENLGEKPISLSFSDDGGITWIEIASDEKNDGWYNWGVPALNSHFIKIKVDVVDLAGNINTSVCAFNFTIDSKRPKIRNVTLCDLTYNLSGQMVDGDDISISAVIDDLSINVGDECCIVANLSVFNLSSRAYADYYDGTTAFWNLSNATHLPLFDRGLSAQMPICITAVDKANSSYSYCGYSKVYPLKVGIIEFAPEDVMYGELLCYYSEMSGCYRLQNMREYVVGDILEDHDFLEIFNNPNDQFFTDFEFCYDPNPYSVYYLEDFFNNEAERYGFSYSDIFEIEIQGPYSLTEDPPRRNRSCDEGIDFFFWNETLKNAVDTSSYDIVVYVYFHDQYLSQRKYDGFVSTVDKGNIAYTCVSTTITSDTQILTIAHELAHLLGADDHYIAPCGKYTYCCKLPEGLAEPDRVPLYPQVKASLMCGYIILVEPGKGHGQAPGSIHQVVISPATAKEIGWVTDV